MSFEINSSTEQPSQHSVNYFYTKNVSDATRVAADGVGTGFAAIAIIAESILIYAIYCCRRTHGPLKTSNLFLLQKSIGDIAFVTSWNMMRLLQDTDVLPATTQFAAFNATTLERIGTYSLYVVNDVSFCHSILMLTLLSIVRVRAVAKPAKTMTISINACPILFTTLVFSCLYCGLDVSYLVLLVPDYANKHAFVRFSYYAVNCIVFYIGPAVVTITAYRKMYNVLVTSVQRFQHTCGEGKVSQSRHRTIIAQRLLAARRLIPLVIMFLVGWLPYWVVHLMSPFMTSSESQTRITYARLLCDVIVTVSYAVKAIYACFVSVHLRSHLTNSEANMRRISTDTSINIVATTSFFQ